MTPELRLALALALFLGSIPAPPADAQGKPPAETSPANTH